AWLGGASLAAGRLARAASARVSAAARGRGAPGAAAPGAALALEGAVRRAAVAVEEVGVVTLLVRLTERAVTTLGGGLELPHHVVVLVLEDVAVVREEPGVALEAGQHAHHLQRIDPHRVLPARLLGRCRSDRADRHRLAVDELHRLPVEHPELQ